MIATPGVCTVYWYNDPVHVEEFWGISDEVSGVHVKLHSVTGDDWKFAPWTVTGTTEWIDWRTGVSDVIVGTSYRVSADWSLVKKLL